MAVSRRKKIKLGQLLLKKKMVTQKQLDKALKYQVIFGGRVGTNLVELGYLDEEALAYALSEQLNVPYAHPKLLLDIEKDVIGLIPRDIAERYVSLPVEIDGKRLKLIMDSPTDIEAIKEISFITGYIIQPMLTTELRLIQALEVHYDIARKQRYIAFRDDIKERRERGEDDFEELITGQLASKTFTKRDLYNPTDDGKGSEEIISESMKRGAKPGTKKAKVPPRRDSPEKYCPSCGEMVETLVIIRSGKETMECANCGMSLDKTALKIKPLKCVLAAEDTPLLLKKVTEMLELKNIANNVVPCKNGEEFIAKATGRMRAGLPVSLAILDVNMPIMNGINAAIVLRSIERALDKNKPAPILFFTSNRLDKTFLKVLKYCSPAQYINKGTGSNPDEFADRLYQVIAGLLSQTS